MPFIFMTICLEFETVCFGYDKSVKKGFGCIKVWQVLCGTDYKRTTKFYSTLFLSMKCAKVLASDSKWIELERVVLRATFDFSGWRI